MSRIVVAIPWWRDGDLLEGALDSVEAAGLEAVCLDGAYRTYLPEGPWLTPQAEWLKRRDDVLMVGGPTAAPFAHEAEKRTKLLRLAEDMGAEWVLFLDADERLEFDAADLEPWMLANPEMTWAYVNIYQPSVGVNGNGWHVPRFIKIGGVLEFRPPRDFDVWRDGARTAWLSGEHPNVEQDPGCRVMSKATGCIRHDRHLRTLERVEMSAAYVNRRREMHGVA